MKEDDAQNGPDYIDATRTVALAAGSYVRRQAVVSDRYDQLSLLRTVELILGLDPLNSALLKRARSDMVSQSLKYSFESSRCLATSLRKIR